MTLKKKVLYALMGFSLLGMIGNTLSSSLNERSKKETKAQLAEQRQSWEFQNTETLTPVIESQSPPSPQPTTTTTTTPNTSLPLSQEAQRALDSLQQTYLSEVNTKAMKAAKEEWEAEQSLLNTKKPKENTVIVPVDPIYTPSSYKAVSPIEQVIVKSIFFNDSRVVAWVEFEGQLIPIKEQSVFLDTVVDSITKNSVVFNEGGRLVTRYMSASKKAVPKNENISEE